MEINPEPPVFFLCLPICWCAYMCLHVLTCAYSCLHVPTRIILTHVFNGSPQKHSSNCLKPWSAKFPIYILKYQSKETKQSGEHNASATCCRYSCGGELETILTSIVMYSEKTARYTLYHIGGILSLRIWSSVLPEWFYIWTWVPVAVDWNPRSCESDVIRRLPQLT